MNDFVYQIVRLDDGTVGMIVQEHAHFSIVQYAKLGHTYTVAVSRDEYEVIGEVGHDHEEM